MSILTVALTLALLAAAIAVVSRPLVAARTLQSTGRPESTVPERGELEVARESKYREIRDAELDYRTGKLSREDYETINGTLRAEAVAILDKLDALKEQAPPPPK